MPHKRSGPKCLKLQPAVAYEHLREHARSLPSLRPPAGYLDPARAAAAPGPGGSAAPADAAPGPDVETDPVGWLRKIASDPAVLERVGSDKARALSAVVSVLIRHQDSAARAARAVPPEDVIKMLRALAEAFAGHLHDTGAHRLAVRLLSLCRQTFGLDLAAANPSAASLLEHEIRLDANETLIAVQRDLDAATRAVPAAPPPEPERLTPCPP
jgi:hypothetical protein